MNTAAHARWKSFLAKVISLMAVLALLVAPACPSLCAAQRCAPTGYSRSSEGHCQAAALMRHNAQQVYAFQKCNVPEAPPATLTSDNKDDVLRWSRSTLPAAIGIGHSLESRNSAIEMKVACSSPPAIAPSDFSPDASILRI